MFALVVKYSMSSVNVKWNLKLTDQSHFAYSGTTILSYVNMVCATLRHSIPKSIVYCQVREAKRSLLDQFFIELGKMEVRINLPLQVS